MTETTILDDSAVSDIEARLHLTTDGDACFVLSNVRALCRTVKHLRELAYVPKILPDDDEVAYRDQAERLLREKVDLQSQLEQLRAENEALRKWQRDVEEREAAVCPEDVPFDEYIWALKKRAAQAREDRDELSTEMETCHSLLDQFYAKDPAMTSLDTLEKRLKLHLDELRPVITDDDVNGDD